MFLKLGFCPCVSNITSTDIGLTTTHWRDNFCNVIGQHHEFVCERDELNTTEIVQRHGPDSPFNVHFIHTAFPFEFVVS